ncbi:MAG: phage tail protein [Bdellovibrio sp.]|nr:phage tail protein [Methylotenera sp.]
MEKRINTIFDRVVNKGLITNKFRGKMQATQMMVSAGLPIAVILRVLTKPQRTRSSD